MLCRWSLGREDAATAIEGAVVAALHDGFRTRDLVPDADLEAAAAAGLQVVGTAGMAAAIGERITILRPVAV
jgi:hypothetical protein